MWNDSDFITIVWLKGIIKCFIAKNLWFWIITFAFLDYFLVNAEFPGVKDKPLMDFDYSTGNWSTP